MRATRPACLSNSPATPKRGPASVPAPITLQPWPSGRSWPSPTRPRGEPILADPGQARAGTTTTPPIYLYEPRSEFSPNFGWSFGRSLSREKIKKPRHMAGVNGGPGLCEQSRPQTKGAVRCTSVRTVPSRFGRGCLRQRSRQRFRLARHREGDPSQSPFDRPQTGASR